MSTKAPEMGPWDEWHLASLVDRGYEAGIKQISRLPDYHPTPTATNWLFAFGVAVFAAAVLGTAYAVFVVVSDAVINLFH